MLVTCIVCGKSVEVNAPPEGINAWKEGLRIQEALPMLTPNEREILMSGICGDCFDMMFAEE